MIHIQLSEEQKPAPNWFSLVNTYDNALKKREQNAIAYSKAGQVEKPYDLTTTAGIKGFLEYINDLWNDNTVSVKENFFEHDDIVGSKCWYSEVDSIGAELEIEHFRPKKQISKLDYTNVLGEQVWRFLDCVLDKQEPRTEGYYWLAFDWTNYRLSCKISNTSKRNYFPLLPNSELATKSGEETKEFPVLIDPLIKEDIELICFEKINDTEVEAVPSVSIPILNGVNTGVTDIDEIDKVNFLRAKISIWVYELNDMKKVKKSRCEVWNSTEVCLKELAKNLNYDKNVTELKNKIDKKAKHSAVARQVVEEFYNSGRIGEEVYNDIYKTEKVK